MRELLRPNLFAPTSKRITLLALLLSLIAQMILVWTGFSYLNNNSQRIQTNEKQGFQSFFQQNLTATITEINNTMDLFEKNDLSKYSYSFLPLRDTNTIHQATEELNEKLNALNLSPSFYKSVYLIGADRNQYSFRMDIGDPDLHVLTGLNKDAFDMQDWTKVLFEYTRKIVRFGSNTLQENYKAFMNDDLKDFAARTSGKLVINNGNIGGIFVIFVLQDDLFNAAEEAQGHDHTPVVLSDDSGQPLWSSITDPNLALRAASAGTVRFSYGDESYSAVRNKLDLLPYQITYLYKADRVDPPVLRVAASFIAVAAAALLLSFSISFVRSRKIFLPFHKFSMAVRRQSLSDDLKLQSVPADLFKSGSRELSLKNKILITFILSVLVPALAGGLLYSFILTQSINKTADQYLTRIGELTKTTAQINIQRLESTINRLTISQELQEFLTTQNTLLNIPYYRNYQSDYSSIAAFPGVNNFSYIVLYDNKGSAIYSSIFSNNPDLFTVNKSLFKNIASSYWVSDYVDITNHYNAAIVKRIPPLNKDLPAGQSYYLLAVPKDDLFENMDFGSSGYYVTNAQNKELFHSHRYSANYEPQLFSYSYPIAKTGMVATFQYPKEEFEAQYREYFYRFLLVLLGVSLFSFLLANMLSSLLSRPIERLMGSINDRSKVQFDHLVQGGSKSEIGMLIANYNEMVDKMNHLIMENMRILEENAQSKLKEKEMNTLKVKAELDMLQSQINPHFLYNTLESINMKSIRYGMHDVSIMIRTLSDMFRYSVGKGSVMVPLQKELDHVKNFVAIHNMRLGHIVELVIDVPERLMNASVLRFSLQPIVENSMKYAFVGFKEGARIVIGARSDEQFLYIEIRDNGIGMDEDRLAEVEAVLNGTRDGFNPREGSSGIGLKNVCARLKLHYPDTPGIRVESELMGGTTVRLCVPLDKNKP